MTLNEIFMHKKWVNMHWNRLQKYKYNFFYLFNKFNLTIVHKQQVGLCLGKTKIKSLFTCAMKITNSSSDLFSLSGDKRKISRMLRKWRYCCRNSSLYESGSRLIRFWSCGKLSGSWLLCLILRRCWGWLVESPAVTLEGAVV